MRKNQRSKAGTAAALMIFCVFSMTVLTVLMLGAGVYRNLSESSRQDYEERVGLSYIWSKVKNMDDGGGFYIGEFHGQPALCFDKVYGASLYRTVIYCYDGYLRELFFEDGLQFDLGNGDPIVRLSSLNFEEGLGGSVYVVAGTDGGDSNSLLLTPRSGAYEVGYE